MTFSAILLPLFVQVGLVFAILVVLAVRRGRAIRAGKIDRDAVALSDTTWPTDARQANNALLNQFQAPVLFYVAVILALVTRKADYLFVALSWLFVLSRVAHAYVHLGSNDLRYRAPIFGVGVVILLVMWILLAVRILLGA